MCDVFKILSRKVCKTKTKTKNFCYHFIVNNILEWIAYQEENVGAKLKHLVDHKGICFSSTSKILSVFWKKNLMKSH